LRAYANKHFRPYCLKETVLIHDLVIRLATIVDGTTRRRVLAR